MSLSLPCPWHTPLLTASHGALLHFYCVKCRVVVCRDCTVVAHSHGEKHKVLDTLDSLATLRSEAVEMLRHYTILETMHAALKDIYRKFKRQVSAGDELQTCRSGPVRGSVQGSVLVS